MSVFVESNIKFDFTQASSAFEYQTELASLTGASATTRNTFWPGIDFHIQDTETSAIWLEVKNWDPAYIEPERRSDSQQSFLSKINSNAFAREMREKFLGTSAFFAWAGRKLPDNVHYLLMFEPPQPLDSALVLAFGHKVKQILSPPKLLPWCNRINVCALTLSDWNKRYPDYTAVKL